mmetsp:Transcript_4207/g.11134  ORF Transcript_4207/g.11134 Transcript_4207/m.11134 type:complete len:230 (-) Transcript_4207:509-1198(-)
MHLHRHRRRRNIAVRRAKCQRRRHDHSPVPRAARRTARHRLLHPRDHRRPADDLGAAARALHEAAVTLCCGEQVAWLHLGRLRWRHRGQRFPDDNLIQHPARPQPVPRPQLVHLRDPHDRDACVRPLHHLLGAAHVRVAAARHNVTRHTATRRCTHTRAHRPSRPSGRLPGCTQSPPCDRAPWRAPGRGGCVAGSTRSTSSLDRSPARLCFRRSLGWMGTSSPSSRAPS